MISLLLLAQVIPDDSFHVWQEIINYSTPLAGLMIIGFAIWKSTRWVATQFVQPFLGAEGLFASYLKAQQAESVLQTKALGELKMVFEQSAHATRERLDSLIEHAKDDAEHKCECSERTRDLIRIHSLIVDAARGLCPSMSQEVDRIFVQIKAIVDRHIK